MLLLIFPFIAFPHSLLSARDRGLLSARTLLLQGARSVADAKTSHHGSASLHGSLPAPETNVHGSQGSQRAEGREMQEDTSPAALAVCWSITSHCLALLLCHITSGHHATGRNPTLMHEEA